MCMGLYLQTSSVETGSAYRALRRRMLVKRPLYICQRSLAMSENDGNRTKTYMSPRPKRTMSRIFCFFGTCSFERIGSGKPKMMKSVVILNAEAVKYGIFPSRHVLVSDLSQSRAMGRHMNINPKQPQSMKIPNATIVIQQ
jgi:hypothetical protein